MSEKPLDLRITRDTPLIFHFRIRDGETISSRGGATVVFEPKLNRFGVSVCSKKDGFNKKLGRKIAVGRARSKRSYCCALGEAPFTMDEIREQAITLASEESGWKSVWKS